MNYEQATKYLARRKKTIEREREALTKKINDPKKAIDEKTEQRIEKLITKIFETNKEIVALNGSVRKANKYAEILTLKDYNFTTGNFDTVEQPLAYFEFIPKFEYKFKYNF